MMALRAATPNDAKAIAHIEVNTWQVAFRDLMPSSYLDALSIEAKAETWRSNLAKHGHRGHKRVVVAIENEHIIGFVRVGTVVDPEPIGLVYLLYVLPEHWQHGVGTALMDAGMSELADLGHATAVLWVLRENVRARRFYERLGWLPDGRVTTDDYGGVSLATVAYQRTIQAFN